MSPTKILTSKLTEVVKSVSIITHVAVQLRWLNLREKYKDGMETGLKQLSWKKCTELEE